MEKMGFATIKFPEMRDELIWYLRELSDLEYQKKCWVLKECPENVQDGGFDYVIHFF